MANYGFRLFWLEIKRNGRGDPQDVEVGAEGERVHFREYLYQLASSRKGVEVHGTPSAMAEDDEDTDEDENEADGERDSTDSASETTAGPASRPVLVISDVQLRGDHVVIDIYYGRRMGYTHAGYSEDAEPGTPPVPIENLKSVRLYRSVFMFPETGEGGIAAVEDASRACPHKKLEQWLRAWAREDARANEEQKRIDTGKKTQKTEWWSARFTPLSDPERLRAMIRTGSSSKIVLVKTGGSDSRTPGRSKLKIEMGLDNPNVLARTRQVLTGWMPASGKGRMTASQAEASRDLAAVLGEAYRGFDSEEYDDAWIDVKDPTGKTKQISPSRWADKFVYPVGSGVDRPTPRLFFRRVMEAVTPLINSLEVSIDWAGWGGDDGEV